MNGVVLAVIGLASALVGGGGVWAYATSRRTSSGQVSTSDADEVFTMMKEYQARADGEMEKLRGLVTKLDDAYSLERRERIQCQSDIAILKSQNASAAIIEAARKEAATIRFDAAKAAEILQGVANEAAATVKEDAVIAKQVVDDAAKP